MSVRILQGDCRQLLPTLADESVHCIVTSPPYFGLRDYGVDSQMGLEASPEEYVAGMVEVFREARRVLRADGTLWLNLGDSYSGSGKGGNKGHGTSTIGGRQPDHSRQAKIQSRRRDKTIVPRSALAVGGLKPKDLIGIPWRVAFALQADGWYLRQDIIWSKPNPMPESVTDRCTKAHEYMFLLSKAKNYYFDAEAIKEKCGNNTHARRAKMPPAGGWDRGPGSHNKLHGNYGKKRKIAATGSGIKSNESFEAALVDMVEFRNKRSVWEVGSQAFSDAHFATFPPELIRPCIRAGCPRGGGNPRLLRRRRHHRLGRGPGAARCHPHGAEPGICRHGREAHPRRCAIAR